MQEKTFVCDPKTGLCHPLDEAQTINQKIEKEPGKEIIYVGDPMCSWCWGISNHLRKLKEHFAHFQFRVIVGGLRPGGGDPWNAQFKEFLKHHWEEVNKRSGQPFGEKLFQQEQFNYDTEPPCRAVVASRRWMRTYEFDFYEAVSRKFYVDNEDPNKDDFYRSICKRFAIPFEEFIQVFHSEEIKQQTLADFQQNREWGVRGFPTVLFRVDQQLFQVNHGYAEYSTMKSTIDHILESTSRK